LRTEISSSTTEIVGIEAASLDSSFGRENNYTLVEDLRSEHCWPKPSA
jgi:hypothetical protein